MQILKIVLTVILVLTSLLLTLLILLHKGQGGGLSDMFGGGLSTGAGSSGVAQKNLDRFTVFVAVIWTGCVFALGILMNLGVQ
jgi:preprotein translocase subunit SecG